MWTFDELSANAQLAANIVVAIGGPTAVVSYIVFWIKDRHAAAEARLTAGRRVFSDVGDNMDRINALILKYPTLGVGWFDLQERKLTEVEKIQQAVLYDMIVALMERAFLAYRQIDPGPERAGEKEGWDKYITDYCRKRSFRAWWRGVTAQDGEGCQFNQQFEDFVNQKMVEAAEQDPRLDDEVVVAEDVLRSRSA